MIFRLLLAAIAGPLIGLLIIAIFQYPAVLLLLVAPFGIAFVYGLLNAAAQRLDAPPRGQPLPPDSLSPPQPANPGLEPSPTTVPGDGAQSPDYGNMLRLQGLRRSPAQWRYRSPAQWRYRSPGMRPPADGSPPA